MEELRVLEARLKQKGGNGVQMPTGLLIDILKLLREHNVRRPDLVVLCGQELLFSADKPCEELTGVDLWNTYEQVLKGALDLNQLDVANQCLAPLQVKFPHSVRVEKLEALVCEASGETESAEDIYDTLLDKNPVDAFCMRRRVALCKSQGATEQGIALLNRYLKVYSSDTEAYAELADMYLSVGDTRAALFCIEEVLLASPNHHVFLVKCAEMLYTLRDYAASRSYYAQALLLLPQQQKQLQSDQLQSRQAQSHQSQQQSQSQSHQPQSPVNRGGAAACRALYGMAMACYAWQQQQQGKQQQKADAGAMGEAQQRNTKLMKMAQEQLMQVHIAQHSALTDTLQQMLLQLLPE